MALETMVEVRAIHAHKLRVFQSIMNILTLCGGAILIIVLQTLSNFSSFGSRCSLPKPEMELVE